MYKLSAVESCLSFLDFRHLYFKLVRNERWDEDEIESEFFFLAFQSNGRFKLHQVTFYWGDRDWNLLFRAILDMLKFLIIILHGVNWKLFFFFILNEFILLVSIFYFVIVPWDFWWNNWNYVNSGERFNFSTYWFLWKGSGFESMVYGW